MSFNQNDVVIYDSLAQFVEACPSQISREVGFGDRGDYSATNGEDYSESMRRAIDGWPEIVDDARRMIEQIEVSDIVTRGLPSYVADVAGDFPFVPAYVAGMPECMFTRGTINAMAPLAPMRVFINPGLQARITAEQAKARGIAVLALVMILTERRPVDLFIFRTVNNRRGGAACPLIRIETRPLDLSTAAYALASSGFVRNLTLTWAVELFGSTCDWAWNSLPTSAEHDRRAREMLEAESQDLLIHAADIHDPLVSNPVAWLKDQVQRHLAQAG